MSIRKHGPPPGLIQYKQIISNESNIKTWFAVDGTVIERVISALLAVNEFAIDPEGTQLDVELILNGLVCPLILRKVVPSILNTVFEEPI